MSSDAEDGGGLENKVVRFGAEWARFGEVAGARKRASILRQFVRWYLRYPGAKLPQRPPRRPEAG